MHSEQYHQFHDVLSSLKYHAGMITKFLIPENHIVAFRGPERSHSLRQKPKKIFGDVPLQNGAGSLYSLLTKESRLTQVRDWCTVS